MKKFSFNLKYLKFLNYIVKYINIRNNKLKN